MTRLEARSVDMETALWLTVWLAAGVHPNLLPSWRRLGLEAEPEEGNGWTRRFWPSAARSCSQSEPRQPCRLASLAPWR